MKLKKQSNIIRKIGANFISSILVFSVISIIIISTPVIACSYTVGTFEEDYSTSKISFYKGETVFGKGTADIHRLLKLRIIDPSNNIVYYSNESYYIVYCSYLLNDSVPTGIWKIQLGVYKCGWKWSTYFNRIACFSVNDANFTLKINIDGNGTVTKEPDKLSYDYGDIVNLNAISDEGWSFYNWTGDIMDSNNSVDILMDGNKIVDAHFIKNHYVINISIVGNGTVTKDPDQLFYFFGSVVNLTAIPCSGYVFDHWDGDVSGNSNPAMISIDGNKNVTAIFVKSYYTISVDVIPVGSGVVDINPSGPYSFGDNVNLTAIPNQGNLFDHWSGDIEGNDNPVTLMMDGNKVIAAHFVVECYNLSVNVIGNGVVIIDPNQENYSFGTLVNLSAVADSGWIFDHWSRNLTGNDNPAKINMNGNKEITAHFIVSNNNGGNGGAGGGGNSNGGNAVSKLSRSKPNIPPIADAGGPYYGLTNVSITFNGSKSYDPDQYIKSWFWDFGDGTTGYGEIFNHSYSEAGYYTVKLVVTDVKRASSDDSADVFIYEPNQPPSSPEIFGPIEGIINVEYAYFIISIDEDGDNIKYTIDWGDGNISKSDYMPQGKYFYVAHKWSEVGIYKIIVTAEDNETISTKELDIIINEPNPKIPEETNLALIILLIIALILLLLLLIYAKKRRKKNQEEKKNQ